MAPQTCIPALNTWFSEELVCVSKSVHGSIKGTGKIRGIIRNCISEYDVLVYHVQTPPQVIIPIQWRIQDPPWGANSPGGADI